MTSSAYRLVPINFAILSTTRLDCSKKNEDTERCFPRLLQVKVEQLEITVETWHCKKKKNLADGGGKEGEEEEWQEEESLLDQ